MATERAWKDRDKLINSINNCEGAIETIKNTYLRLNTDKQNIIDDNDRLTELTTLLGEDPNNSPASLNSSYNDIKDVYDYLIGEGW